MNRIFRAFWHRTRKVFVPLTLEEVSRRAGVSPDEAHRELWGMSTRGLATAIKGEGKAGTSTWHLTDYGQHLTTTLMQQQERLKA